jgi:hypothetical protein
MIQPFEDERGRRWPTGDIEHFHRVNLGHWRLAKDGNRVDRPGRWLEIAW